MNPPAPTILPISNVKYAGDTAPVFCDGGHILVPATLYRIKLYGHSSGDTELFCQNLATILDIDPARARSLLLDSPAVIKEGIEKEKAEEFCKLLEPIRALCIVEPVGGDFSEDVPSEAIAPVRLPESPEVDDLKKKAVFRSWIWMGALVLTVGTFLLFVAGGFMSSFWSLYHHNRPPATSSEGKAGSAASQAEPQPPDARPVSVGELQSQIDELEARIEVNRFNLAQAEEARDKLHRSARSTHTELEESALIIRDLTDRIRSDVAQLRTFKRRLEEIERAGE